MREGAVAMNDRRDTCKCSIETESATVHNKNCLLDNVQRLITSTVQSYLHLIAVPLNHLLDKHA